MENNILQLLLIRVEQWHKRCPSTSYYHNISLFVSCFCKDTRFSQEVVEKIRLQKLNYYSTATILEEEAHFVLGKKRFSTNIFYRCN